MTSGPRSDLLDRTRPARPGLDRNRKEHPTEADVTEGSSGIWERLHYDWSDPDRVVLTTTDSNTWSNKSSHTYTFKRQPEGKTEVDYVVVRDGKNLKGHLLGFVVGTVGKGRLKKAFDGAVKAIEARGGEAGKAID